jgi:hypothetical protein
MDLEAAIGDHSAHGCLRLVVGEEQSENWNSVAQLPCVLARNAPPHDIEACKPEATEP